MELGSVKKLIKCLFTEMKILANCGCEIKKKEAMYCSKCGNIFCPKHLFFYVDGNNISITKNSKPHCERCYLITYGNK